jgi:hypothetical protein
VRGAVPAQAPAILAAVRRLLAIVPIAGAAAVLAAGASPVFAAVSSNPCRASMLSGSFRAVYGSAGAGQITYALRLRNSSTSTCFVTGLPGLTLLAASGRPLPTHAAFGGPRGVLTAILVTLSPGRSALLTARFSPDVPGPGESQTTACEPRAARLRVSVSGGGSLLAPITPPTSVCEHGTMGLTILRPA